MWEQVWEDLPAGCVLYPLGWVGYPRCGNVASYRQWALLEWALHVGIEVWGGLQGLEALWVSCSSS